MNIKAVGIASGLGLAGIFGYVYFAPNTGYYWLGKIGARNPEELDGYFNGIVRGIKRAGGSQDVYASYLTEWKNYWYAQSPDAKSVIDYWSEWALTKWSKVN